MHRNGSRYPYVIAIEPTFIEIWDIITCTIKQVIPDENLRCLFTESSPSGTMYYADPQMHQSGPVNGVAGHPLPPDLAGPHAPLGSPSSQHHQPHSHVPQQMMRPSLQGAPGYGMQLPYGLPPASVYDGYGFGRQEILLGSDDSIMLLKPLPSAI